MKWTWMAALVILACVVGAFPSLPAMSQVPQELNSEQFEPSLQNVALGKPVTVTTNGANENRECAGMSPADITDGSLDYIPASRCVEDGVVGYVNDDYNQLMRITITINLQRTYRISKIRYNMGHVQRAETWNADTMITPFGTTGTRPGTSYNGAWTEHVGDATLSSVTIVLEKTRVSWPTDWLFVGEIEVYGTATETATISGIEVTQAIQCMNTPAECFGPAHSSWCTSGDCTNAVPLLLYKPTWARVYVQGQPDGVRVDASLEGHAQNGDPLPGSPIFSPVTVIAHPEGGDRGKPGDSFNFRLPVEWTLQKNITLRARIYLAAGEPSVDSRELSLAFTERAHMLVYSWRFRFPNVAAATPAEARAAAHFTAQVYPINSDALDLRDQGELQTRATTWQDLAAELAKPCADARRKSGYHLVRCYGWVPKDITMRSRDGNSYYGWTDHGVSVGYVYRPPLAGGVQNLAPQYIMAHELGHTFSPLGHVATSQCGGTSGGTFEDQFPNTTGSIGQYGFYDSGTPRVYVPTIAWPDHPINYFDFMSYCGVDTNRQWVSPYTYRHLYDAFGAPYLTYSDFSPATEMRTYLVASGVITPSGSISLNPFYQEQYPAGSYDTVGSGSYQIELQNAQGNVLFTRFFDQTAPEWRSAVAVPVQFFQILPFSPSTRRVVIKRGITVLGQISTSTNPPLVTLFEPQAGLVSGDAMRIRWAGTDLDSDPLRYMVQYSADNGQSWQTLTINVAESTLTVKTADLPGSIQARVRVLASDGLNTSVAESGLLQVPTKAPDVTIMAPQQGALLLPGQPINLSGIAEDREEGPLSGTALTWQLDGNSIGFGSQLTLFDPPTGQHTITLTAVDRNGATASARISVFVGYRVHIPLIMRNR